MQPEHEHAEVISLTVAGSQTSVYAYGQNDAPVVLAVHGFRGTHFGLEPLAVRLASRGFRVLAPDLPGAGRSTPLPGTHDASGYGLWLTELAAALPRPRVLLGHSLGSVIVGSAIASGAAHDAAVLINPILESPLSGPKRVATAATRFYYALAERLPPTLGHRLLASRLIAGIGATLMTSTSDRALRRWIRDEHFRQVGAFASRDVVLEAFEASMSTTVSDFGTPFDRPTLLLAADRDPLSATSACAAYAAGLRSGTFHVFPDRGHLLPYEEAHALAIVISDWDRTVVGNELRA